ncbi:MAG: MBL fold metallo-hydrolase [Synergistaceae bacterium]|nr:MBL fold metallo-hydrolase [Synergistaceae bacterium]
MKFSFMMFVIALSFLFSTAYASKLHAAASDTFTAQVGDMSVTMLSEAQREGGLDILIGAASEDIAEFIPTGLYPSAVAAYLIESPDGAILVDTGFGREIERNMGTRGLKPSDVKTVLITHAHGDHIGGLLKDGAPAYPNAGVIISKLDYDWSAQARAYLSKYTGGFETITPGELAAEGTEVLPGIRAIAAYGHTPGHTMFMLESKGEKLLIWGDLTHAMAIQMPRPGVSVTYDSDPVAAARTRLEVLKYVSENKIPIAGMHVAFPGIGLVEPDGDNPGGYKFIPADK